MSEIETQAQVAMENLLKYDESQLYQQLGIRKKMLETNPTAAGTFNLEVTDDEASMMRLTTLFAVVKPSTKRIVKNLLMLLV